MTHWYSTVAQPKRYAEKPNGHSIVFAVAKQMAEVLQKAPEVVLESLPPGPQRQHHPT